jgi:uncharacterized protein YndB with AHSA1/START domain
MTSTETTVTTHVYRVWIRATPEAVWEAITSPAWNSRYGYHAATEYDLRPGGPFRIAASPPMIAHGAPEIIIDGEVVEIDPPRRLVQTYRFLWDPELIEEGFTRVTWELDEDDEGVTRLTVVHDLEGAPKHAHIVSGSDPQAGGGWAWVLSDLKSLLETGTSLKG